MRESQIEKRLADKIKFLGGLCWKFTSPNMRGVPDRVVILPQGKVVWVELKRPGAIPTAQQLRRHRELWKRGHAVVVLDSIESVDTFIQAHL